jgi:hypothetical protein
MALDIVFLFAVCSFVSGMSPLGATTYQRSASKSGQTPGRVTVLTAEVGSELEVMER